MELKELRHKRKTLGLTQKALADEIGTNRSTLSLLERGKRKPSFEIMSKISKVFNEPFEIK